jgi:hypothetical protein
MLKYVDTPLDHKSMQLVEKLKGLVKPLGQRTHQPQIKQVPNM